MPTVLEAVMDAPTLPHKLWTREDCAVLEKAGLIEAERYELIEGELILKMGKNHPHVRALAILARWLRSCFGDAPVVQESPIDLRAEDRLASEPEPDVSVLVRAVDDFSTHPRPEELRLVAEISLTSLLFDLTTKSRLYARSGIVEYWVLDVAGRRLIVHREPVDGRYRSVVAFGEEERVATLAAPEKYVRVGDLL